MAAPIFLCGIIVSLAGVESSARRKHWFSGERCLVLADDHRWVCCRLGRCCCWEGDLLEEGAIRWQLYQIAQRQAKCCELGIEMVSFGGDDVECSEVLGDQSLGLFLAHLSRTGEG